MSSPSPSPSRPALLLALALLACNRGSSDRQGAEAEPAGGSAAGVVGLDGEARDPLAPDDRADALIFVRSDCPISNRYAPKLGRIAARYADAPVDLWLVYVDPDETPELIRTHMADYALPGTPLRDPQQSLVRAASIEVTPSVAVYDAKGTLAYRGRIDDWYVDYGKQRATASTDEFADALEAVLDGRAPAVARTDAVGCPIPGF